MKNIFLFSIVLLALALPASAQNIVSIGNFAVDGNVEIRVPIYLNDSINVASAQIRLDYNPTVVRAYSDPNLDYGTFSPLWIYLPDNSNNASGWITITTAKIGMGGLNGNQTIGYVRLKAVGNSGSSSPLDLNIISLTDDAGDELSPMSVKDGTFDIAGSALKYIVISPSPTTTLTVGGNQLFTATALDQDSISMAGINISWTVSNSTVGNVDLPNAMTNLTGGATTTFTALVAGTTMVNASNGSFIGTAIVTVETVPPFLNLIEVLPTTKTLFVGDNFTFTAYPKDQYGDAFTATVTWSSSNTTVGTVDTLRKVHCFKSRNCNGQCHQRISYRDCNRNS